MKKKLAVGGENFPNMIRNHCYYVDKTGFIRTVMESESRVLLVTRPRRFGKTLFIDTLKSFLQIDFVNPGAATKNAALFSGLAVMQQRDFCAAFMGQYPVISISLKGVEGASYEKAYRRLAGKLSEVAKQYEFLLQSPGLDAADKAKLRRYLNVDDLRELSREDDCKDFLKNLTTWLFKHFERQVVLLVDEYDVPLAKAAQFGYYQEMLEMVRSFLGNILKEDPKAESDASTYLLKAVLTGCLRVSKESIFTDVNNFDINTVCSCDMTLSEMIGFTPNEVETLLAYYGLSSRLADVRHWYDGYRFYRSEIYCPWDVVNFAEKALASGDIAGYLPENYWDKTSGNAVIEEFLGFLSSDDADRMQSLVDGNTIDLTVNEKLTYGDFVQHKSQDFWTLLLYAGYLTAVDKLGLNRYRVRIPNEEIRDSFSTNIELRFSEENAHFVTIGRDFAKAALDGDADRMAEVLVPLLESYVSIRDTATKAPAENYYCGFLTALLTCAGSYAKDVSSNVEAGDGFADLVFTSGVGTKRIGVVIEVKRCAKPNDMYDTAEAALRQIKEKRYAAYLDRLRCGKECLYGIAFCRKDCAVAGGAV